MMPLSIVMPAYNEAEHIEQCVLEWHERVVARIPGAEIIVVNDCSKDDTGVRLHSLAARLPALRVLTTPTNGGHGPALRFGIDRALGEFVFHTDSDRQHTPEDFWALWELRDAADFVFGVRDHRADGAFRSAISSMMRLANALLWGYWIRDANCPYKLMRRTALEQVMTAIPRSSFIPMVMVSVLARRAGFRISEVRVRHFPRVAGQQSLTGLLKWARISRRCVGELVALRFSDTPGRPQQDRVDGRQSPLP
ncbi:MAG TPA: glycosyltransferase family 2 protein [Vicinamibacterales bacterium]|jgi:glycosyltransferase involved in cell wall biosynthesis